MQQKKIPVRMCAGCGEHFPKKELVRIVHTPQGEIHMDLTGRMAGRGAYLCRNAECLRKAQKAKRLERACRLLKLPKIEFAFHCPCTEAERRR